jgi:23S rRNA (guanosine2251-2'-O)-methyltransferase
LAEKKYWIYGFHAVEGALANPKREVFRLVALKKASIPSQKRIRIEYVDKIFFQKLFGPHAVHQGIALEVAPLASIGMEELVQTAPQGPILILDQLTDPHNVGAILRSAAAFGAAAVITTDKNAPEISNPALMKAASGALDLVPYIQVSNLARAMEQLKKHDYWLMGLDEKGTIPLHKAPLDRKTAFVLGAEGDGLRRLTRENCDFLFFIETAKEFSTLNVSNAAAVSLYAWTLHSNTRTSDHD